MKQLTCEMCGGTDLLKQDGVFVCQSCGTKYSVEEAKKMMVEGVVDVSGSTVKVDNSESINNYYKIAEQAYESHNLKEAESYCNKIIEIDSMNYKAWMLKGKSAGWQTTMANNRIKEALNCFNNAIEYAPDDKKNELKVEYEQEVVEQLSASIRMLCNKFEKNPTTSNSIEIRNEQLKSVLLLGSEKTLLKNYNNNVSAIIENSALKGFDNYCVSYDMKAYPSSEYDAQVLSDYGTAAGNMLWMAAANYYDKNDKIRCYKKSIATYQSVRSRKCYYNNVLRSISDTNVFLNDINKCVNEIKKLDPTYIGPMETNRNSSSYPPSNNSGGCYVATAVYGSYDCPQVWTLRRYRDNDLATTWYGRGFICIYYAISPTLVKWFGHTEWFKKMWKGKLDKMVKKLQDKGYDSTPYEDKQW